MTAPGASFSDVSGTWVEPSVGCVGRRVSYASFWIGLGGFAAGSQGLEQIGTSSDCRPGGHAAYGAWYELIPAGPVTIPLTVAPGDTISAEVRVDGTTVSLQIHDVTARTAYSTQVAVPSPDFSSAEWIAEAPSQCMVFWKSRCQPLRLADFGTVSFSAAAATANGHTGPISDPAWTAVPTALLGGPRGSPAAVPSALSADGSSFSVVWQSIGQPTGPPAGDRDGTTVGSRR